MGRAVKLRVASGRNGAGCAARPARTQWRQAAARAEQDPIVQRMQEKFGAEIRTIIDYKTSASCRNVRKRVTRSWADSICKN